jgi:osmoprotectant transport system permease protein
MQAVKYRALSEGAVDVIDGYSTDGALAEGELVVLEDDLGFFPPYEAAPVVSRRLAAERPAVLDILGGMAGRIGVVEMRRANRRAEVEGVPVARVARDPLLEAGLVSPAPGAAPAPAQAEDAGAIEWEEVRQGAGTLLVLTAEHLFLVALSLLCALLLAIPLGLALSGGSRAAEPVLRGVGVLQTIPSIALLAFMIPLLGVGVLPAVVALFLYSLLPVLRNTVTGLDEADPDAAEAGRALGMTPREVLTQIRLPLAAPVIMAGVRTAAVINVGTATLAAFIGAGGLGEPIVAGLALSDNGLILSGAIPAAALALVVDGGLAAVERRVSPRGVESPGR